MPTLTFTCDVEYRKLYLSAPQTDGKPRHYLLNIDWRLNLGLLNWPLGFRIQVRSSLIMIKISLVDLLCLPSCGSGEILTSS
jgi:hypothetical protein